MCCYAWSEGSAFEYWANRIGSTEIDGGGDDTKFPLVYSFENHSEVAEDFWLRSPATWDDSSVTLMNYSFNTQYDAGTRTYLAAGYYGDPEGYAIAFTPIYAMPVSVIC
jgi:hypothetical protein